MTQYVTLGSDL